MIASSTGHGNALLGALRRVDLRVALAAAAALVASASASQAQVELKTYMDDKGYLNVRALNSKRPRPWQATGANATC